MNWEQLAKRLVPWVIMVFVSAFLLGVASLSCYGWIILIILVMTVTGIAAFECSIVFVPGGRLMRCLAFLALVPGVSVLFSAGAAGGCLSNQVLHTGGTPSSVGLLLAVFLLYSVTVLAGRAQREITEKWFAGYVPAILFLAAGSGAASQIAVMPDSASLAAWIILVTVVNDSAAYLAGNLAGGPLMAPAISPAKTWSGSIGGLSGAVITGAACSGLLPAGIGLAGALFLALLAGIAGQVGDLTESYLKRYAGTKDFGTFAGSHGGVFDRIDSHFGAVIVFYVMLEILL